MSRIERLVAMAIGSFLIIGAVTLQSNTRRSFTVTEQAARLQETARYVMSVLEPEIQLAGLYGYTNNPGSVKMEVEGTEYYGPDMRATKDTLPDLPESMSDCGPNFVVDLSQTVQASDGAYTLDCDGLGGAHYGNSDTITLRRASLNDEGATGQTVQLYTNRLFPMDQRLFISNVEPSAVEEGMREIRDLIVQTYYVASDAEGHPGVPALRLKQLIPSAGGPIWDDREIIRGVEDLQFEFGVDPGEDKDGDGKPDDVSNDGMADLVNGNALRYVPPGDALMTSGQVVAVRVWIRVRAQEPETGFVDGSTYTYGSTVDFKPKDGFRRVLMSRTIFLRNTRSFTS
jgi:type IV pilus assembly protein PilW